mmetsp:Transcript_9581/g.24486  ORF Transcript_9581/g.24486 Transcript_9581/m.24486 type:complete len:207 (+) Transcript_9581:1653-2273(+)
MSFPCTGFQRLQFSRETAGLLVHFGTQLLIPLVLHVQLSFQVSFLLRRPRPELLLRGPQLLPVVTFLRHLVLRCLQFSLQLALQVTHFRPRSISIGYSSDGFSAGGGRGGTGTSDLRCRRVFQQSSAGLRVPLRLHQLDLDSLRLIPPALLTGHRTGKLIVRLNGAACWLRARFGSSSRWAPLRSARVRNARRAGGAGSRRSSAEG